MKPQFRVEATELTDGSMVYGVRGLANDCVLVFNCTSERLAYKLEAILNQQVSSIEVQP